MKKQRSVRDTPRDQRHALSRAAPVFFLAVIAMSCSDVAEESSPDAGDTCAGTVDDCGVCNGNNEDKDCAGTCFGDAVEDMCGTCDADPANDCAEDCAGTWGGSAYEDMCGTCDDAAETDCYLEGDWDCQSGQSCYGLYSFDFEAGAEVDIEVDMVTGDSVVDLALYAPGTEPGGVNLLTESTDTYRCSIGDGCDEFADGESASITIPETGTYHLAVTRDYGYSCGSGGTYRLSVFSSSGYTSFENVANVTTGLDLESSCPLLY